MMNDNSKAQVKLLKDALTGELKVIAERIEERLAKLDEKATNNKPKTSEKDLDKTKPQKGCGAARCLMYLYRAGGKDVDKAINMAQDAGDHYVADVWEKAMATESLSAGGALLPAEFVGELIEELGAKAQVRASGVSPADMDVPIPYIDTSASATWVGEAAAVNEGTPTFGQLQFNPHKLVCVGALSNEMLIKGGERSERILANHLVRVIARAEDLALITSDGSSNEPQGLLYLADSSNKFNANATVSLANVTVDMSKALLKLEDNNVDMTGNVGWLIAPRVKHYFRNVLDSNGNAVFRNDVERGVLFGYPFKVSSQIVTNAGSGTNETKIYLAAFQYMMLAEDYAMQVEMFPNATFSNSSGTLVSGISTDQSAVRVKESIDFGASYRGKEIAVIEAAKWGA